MIRTISILVLSSIFYFIFIKPLRLLVDEHIFLPAFNYLLFNYDVTIPRSDHTEVLIKSLNNNNKVLFRMPFNGFYIVPSILMVVENQIDLFKKYTFIHLAIIILPLLLFIFGLSSILKLLGEDIFKMLVIILSLIFTTLVITHKNDEGKNDKK